MLYVKLNYTKISTFAVYSDVGKYNTKYTTESDCTSFDTSSHD